MAPVVGTGVAGIPLAVSARMPSGVLLAPVVGAGVAGVPAVPMDTLLGPVAGIDMSVTAGGLQAVSVTAGGLQAVSARMLGRVLLVPAIGADMSVTTDDAMIVSMDTPARAGSTLAVSMDIPAGAGGMSAVSTDTRVTLAMRAGAFVAAACDLSAAFRPAGAAVAGCRLVESLTAGFRLLSGLTLSGTAGASSGRSVSVSVSLPTVSSSLKR